LAGKLTKTTGAADTQQISKQFHRQMKDHIRLYVFMWLARKQKKFGWRNGWPNEWASEEKFSQASGVCGGHKILSELYFHG
jgi:hypothetical protein